MRHAFTTDTPAGTVCSICGVAQRENDLVPRCESMPHPGRPGDGADALAAELVGAGEAARVARALELGPMPRYLIQRAQRAGGT